jgi:hypothetical protein
MVYATRLDRLIFMKGQPRSFRWTPLLVIAALITGYVLMAQTMALPDRKFWIGWLLFYGAFVAAAFLRVLGPAAPRPLDERELIVKARAYALSGVVLASLAMFGCFYMASEGVPWLWHPHAVLDWFNLGFGFQAGGMILPTLIASWLQPRPVAGDDD